MNKNLVDLLSDEELCWNKIQQLRQDFSPDLLSRVKVDSPEEAFERTVRTINLLLSAYKDLKVTYTKKNPAHGVGHLIRDYIHTLTLVENLDAHPKHLFVGGIAGMLHDTGCCLVERFNESGKRIKHAEAGALLFDYVTEQVSSGLNDAERTIISHAIAAHAHYRQSEIVTGSNGKKYVVEPYQELDDKGQPLLEVWLPRWIDRLDCSGPCWFARHYLTLPEEHEDHDGDKFINVSFVRDMQPRLLSKEEREEKSLPVTVLEYVKGFADSQTNNSPYGKHDFGKMVEIRDVYKEMLLGIVSAIDTSAKCGAHFTSREEKKALGAWKSYLSNNIEPTPLGLATAEKLDGMFRQLPDQTRWVWEQGFVKTMTEYKNWSLPLLQQMDNLALKYGSEILSLPGITEDVRKVITPRF